MLYANFNKETGECVWCGEDPADFKLPESFKGRFPKRYRMVDGEIVDDYAGKSDKEAEKLWLEKVYVDPDAPVATE